MQAGLQPGRFSFKLLFTNLETIPGYFLQPVRLISSYRRSNLGGDIVAALTVSVVLLPQAIVFSFLAGLPPEMGVYTAIVGSIVGALWGSSSHLCTGPTNSSSLLVLSVLIAVAEPGSPKFVAAAGMVAVMGGALRLLMGMARLGTLVNFVSDSVIVGFAAGAGVLIVVGQLRQLLRLEFARSPSLITNLIHVIYNFPATHLPTLGLGLGVILLILVLRRINRKLPGPFLAMVGAAAVVASFDLDQVGVQVLGELPSGLPPLARLPWFDLELIGELSTGAMAIAIIGLVQAVAISRSIAAQTGQRLDSNQEFIGQGLANLGTGLLSGFPCTGSFNRSALNLSAGAQTAMASALAGVFVLLTNLVLAPFAAYVPRAALAGVLVVVAYDMVDRKEMARIWRGSKGDALIMSVTLVATLFLPLQFAVLTGILMSLAYYLWQTSIPQIFAVVPDEDFRHFVRQIEQPSCPQLGVIEILGDLYFGAANHFEEALLQNLRRNPDQRFLLLHMHSVNQVDISGIHALESIVRTYRERGGDVFVTRARSVAMDFMMSIGFYATLGPDNFLAQDGAVSYLFHKVLDPAVCIYECDVRVFKECQNLPKRVLPTALLPPVTMNGDGIVNISPRELWMQLRSASPPLVVDVREPREFKLGHVPQAQLRPLLQLLTNEVELPRDRPLVLTCRSGRRSVRAALALREQGYENVMILKGGVLAWEAADLLEAIEV